MKILFFTNILSDGGAERVMSILANNVAKRGDECVVILRNKSNKEYFLDKRVKKIYLFDGVKEKRDNIATKVKVICAIRKILKKEKPNYIIPFLTSPMIEAYFASRFMKSKFVSTIRVYPANLKKGIKRFLRDYIIKKSYKVIVQNQEQKNYFKKRVHHKIEILHNPVSDVFFETNKEYYDKDIIKLITAGRLADQKNHKLLISSAISLKQKYNIELEIYGQGPLFEELNAYIDENNANTYISLKGNVNDIYNKLIDADIFVLSSNFEGLPNALIEAMAVGLACVSTNCPTGPLEIITDNVDGILCETNNLASLTEAIEKVICDKKLMRDLGGNARKKMLENYSEQIVIDKFYSILNDKK